MANSTDDRGQRSEGASLGFPRHRTALLVIDPVNDFLSEGGAAWDLTKNTVQMNDVIPNLRRAIDAAREHGVPVLFGPMAYTEHDYADDALQHRSGINRIMFERRMFLAGSWGADFHEQLRPLDDEIVLKPHKGTDVFETDLPEHLQQLSITHLVIAGMTANLCCESTGRHAAEAGYDVTFLSDAIGSESVPSYEAAIRVNYPLIGNGVIQVEQFVAALGEADPGEVQAGDTVYGSDHLKIGTVDRVERGNGDVEPHLVVPRGLVFSHDVFVPLDAVVRRIGTDAFINVPRLVIGEIPWDEPPTRQDRHDKSGPVEQTVEKLYSSRSPSAQDRADPSRPGL
ncbi:MAG: isochorismatase family protein [Wenzhouxiangella sp.]